MPLRTMFKKRAVIRESEEDSSVLLKQRELLQWQATVAEWRRLVPGFEPREKGDGTPECKAFAAFKISNDERTRVQAAAHTAKVMDDLSSPAIRLFVEKYPYILVARRDHYLFPFWAAEFRHFLLQIGRELLPEVVTTLAQLPDNLAYHYLVYCMGVRRVEYAKSIRNKSNGL